MASKFNLKVVTPTRTPYDGEVETVILPGTQGELAILSDHMPLVVALSGGITTIRNEGEDRVAMVFGGIAQVLENQLTLIVPYFEWSDEIDQHRAQAAIEDAERRMSETESAEGRRRVELAIRRNNVRLEVSSYSVIKGRVGGS